MNWTSIITTVIASAATIITVIIQTHKSQTKAEVNDYKTYLLLLLSCYPRKADEIFNVARHYFEDLGGDSFIVPLFGDWLSDNKLEAPEWFLTAKAKHPGIAERRQ